MVAITLSLVGPKNSLYLQFLVGEEDCAKNQRRHGQPSRQGRCFWSSPKAPTSVPQNLSLIMSRKFRDDAGRTTVPYALGRPHLASLALCRSSGRHRIFFDVRKASVPKSAAVRSEPGSMRVLSASSLTPKCPCRAGREACATHMVGMTPPCGACGHAGRIGISRQAMIVQLASLAADSEGSRARPVIALYVNLDADGPLGALASGDSGLRESPIPPRAMHPAISATQCFNSFKISKPFDSREHWSGL